LDIFFKGKEITEHGRQMGSWDRKKKLKKFLRKREADSSHKKKAGDALMGMNLGWE
jgi:hypothetical protein